MKRDVSGTGLTLCGVAVMAACGCGASSQLGKLSASYGYSFTERMVHPLFVFGGAVLLLAGLWRRSRTAALLPGIAAVAALAIGEALLPTMGITEGVQLTSAQLGGVIFYLAAGAFLVVALLRAFPFEHRGASTLAFAGLAASVGCNCCLVAQGIAGFTHVLTPSQHWHANSLTIYAVATVAMAIGLYRLAGATPMLLMIFGHALNYWALELPYSKAPAITVHGVSLGFVSKYPLMLVGALIMVGGFALAYATERGRTGVVRPAAEPVMGD